MNGKDLPIWATMPQILTHLAERRNVIITAPTGSGKTTQVPQAILDAGLAGDGIILVVQPRRVACRAAAKCVARERGSSIGRQIGYIIRYDRQVSLNTRICFVTDGVLMRLLERDMLAGVSIVIFDEFHERRVLTDLALGLCKNTQKRRSDLRIVVMSATLSTQDTQRLIIYLNNATVVMSAGRSFDVDIRHTTVTPQGQNLVPHVISQILKICHSKEKGDILVFLPGKAEIVAVKRSLLQREAKHRVKLINVIPLHGELTGPQQDLAFKNAVGRKVILATNVAETSVTIPGIRIVIDSGFERRYSFDQNFGVDTLRLTRISQSSAAQRTGRAGREAPGKCIRLWSPEIHESLEATTPPEISRVDLSSVILSLKAMGIKDCAAFDFFEAPLTEQLTSAHQLLKMLGALDEEGELMPIGWRMFRLPLPPRYARMMVEAERCGCIPEVATITAFLAGRSPFLHPPYKEHIAAKQHKALAIDDSSDMFTFLAILYQMYECRHNFLRWCNEYFLNADAFPDLKRLRHRIIGIALRRGSKWRKQEWVADKRDAAALRRKTVRRAIASGLVDRLGHKVGPGVYEFASGVKATLSKASVVSSDFIVAGEIRSIGGHNPVSIASLITQVDIEMMESLAPSLFTDRQVILARYPVTGLIKIQQERRYMQLLLRHKSGLVAERSGSNLTERLSSLTNTVVRLKQKEN